MPLMEAFEQNFAGASRYIFVPKPGKHGEVLNAVSVASDGTTRFEIKGRSKTEIAKKAALLEKALGGKVARQDCKQPDGSITHVFTAITELKSLSGLIPKGDLQAAMVEAIRRGVIAAPPKASRRMPKATLSITVSSISDELPGFAQE